MLQKQLFSLISLLIFSGLVGCLGPANPADEHPCQLVNNCVYDEVRAQSNCASGYTWENPNDVNNYNCVEIRGAGQTATPDQSGQCPANSTLNADGTQCICDSGFQATSDGTGCELSGGQADGAADNTGNPGNDTPNDGSTDDDDPCPPNSSLGPDGDSCYCDEGYVVNSDGTACVPGESGGSSGDNGGCPPNSSPAPDGSGCYCDEGYVVNEDQTGCVPECTTNSDCDNGYECIENQCRVPPCTPGSCDDGLMCSDSGVCVVDLGSLPSAPATNCNAPSWQCTGTDCGDVVAFEPNLGDGYWDYNLNGESVGDEYRSYIRKEVMMLIKYAAASVNCMGAAWTVGNGEPLGLGDMSEANGDIPGTRENQPGHPEGTHVNGFDMDIAYYQLFGTDNKLRSVCDHVQNGQDQYRCVSEPDNFDVWRTALFFAKMHDSPYLRVIGADGKIGPQIESAITQMCDAGWLPGNSACDSMAVAYETTNQGQGWYNFHHHHFHISTVASPHGLTHPNQGMSCLLPGCEAVPVDYDPRRYLYIPKNRVMCSGAH
tara:strand:+ start:86 stop:1720 length:1635 start_codon:yes stop_codon:yes gene_type:complete